MGKSIRKTIQLLCPSFYPAIGGVETNILEVYSVLVNKGWKVIVHTSKNTLTRRDVLSTKGTIRGIIIKRYASSNLGFKPNIDWSNLDLLIIHNFDIFTYSKIFLNTWFLKLVKRKNFSLIFIPHGTLVPARQWFTLVSYTLRKILYPTLGAFLINRSVDGIRAVSIWERDKLISMGVRPDLIETITNGIENIAFTNFDKKASLEIKRSVRKFGRYIIQVGRINGEKNYETVIKAIKIIPKDVKYLIIGPIQDKHYYKYLKSLIKKLHIGNQVIFLGKVSIYDKYYLIKHAQAMVHMSLSEGFGNSVHEGMSQGLPCIVSNSTALPFLIKQNVNGFCINPKNHKLLGEKINFLLNKKNKKIIHTIRKTNIAVTRDHTWENVALKVEEFYNSVHVKTL